MFSEYCRYTKIRHVYGTKPLAFIKPQLSDGFADIHESNDIFCSYCFALVESTEDMIYFFFLLWVYANKTQFRSWANESPQVFIVQFAPLFRMKYTVGNIGGWWLSHQIHSRNRISDVIHGKDGMNAVTVALWTSSLTQSDSLICQLMTTVMIGIIKVKQQGPNWWFFFRCLGYWEPLVSCVVVHAWV